MAIATAVPVTSVPAVPAGSGKFDFDLKQVERGLPLAALEEFASYSGFGMKALLEVVIPLRTLKHRRERKEPLNVDESDRLARVVRIFQLAHRIFDDQEDGREWLATPKDRFEERTPLSLLRTETGERAVVEFLYQIDEGVFA